MIHNFIEKASEVAPNLPEKASAAAMYGGAALATLNIVQWCNVIGVLIALAGFCYNVYHKRQVLKAIKEKASVNFTDD